MTPGGAVIGYLILGTIVFCISVLISRWVFRINQIVELLEKISSK